MLPRKGDYGIDAPYVPIFMALGSLPLFVGTFRLARAGDVTGVLSMGLSGSFLLACALSYLYTTRVGKFREWDALLEQLALKGNERVLDMGCGRGAVLLLAAQRVPQGKVTGVDLWQVQDQSGNAAEATRRNAELEGVADRIELHTADMRKLPLPDASFDLIVSSLAIHNIPDAEGRAQAVREAVRCLAPGGRILLADLRATDEYVRALQSAGMAEVSKRRLGVGFWYGGPWAATRLVTARKPA